MMDIRPLKLEDRREIIRLLEERETFPEHEIKVAIEVIDDALRFPEREDYQIFCAFDPEKKLAGYICFGRIPMTDGCFDLYWIVVDKKWSRKGIGRLLIEHMEKLSKAQGARKIFIETSSLPAFEAARSFYKKHQYEIASTLADFYKMGDNKIIFLKDLNSV